MCHTKKNLGTLEILKLVCGSAVHIRVICFQKLDHGLWCNGSFQDLVSNLGMFQEKFYLVMSKCRVSYKCTVMYAVTADLNLSVAVVTLDGSNRMVGKGKSFSTDPTRICHKLNWVQIGNGRGH